VRLISLRTLNARFVSEIFLHECPTEKDHMGKGFEDEI